MEEKGKETIAAFDRLLTTNRIQMMKVLLSHLAPEQQNGLAVYIKLSELQYTIELARRSPRRPLFGGHSAILSLNSLLDGSLFGKDREGVLELLDELLPFSGPKERAQIQNIRNLLASFSRLREMMTMMDMIKELFPDGMPADGSPGDLFSGMASMAGMAGADGKTDAGDAASGLGGIDPTALFQMMQMFQTPPAPDVSDSADNVPPKDPPQT